MPGSSDPAGLPVPDSSYFVPQAYSHFSYVESQRDLLVCDVQGHGQSFRYTDPQVHSTDKRYGKADLGDDGAFSVPTESVNVQPGGRTHYLASFTRKGVEGRSWTGQG